MTPPIEQRSVEEIAAGLTKAQKRAIAAAEPKIYGDPDSLFLPSYRDGGAIAESLHNAGLVAFAMRGLMLTALGLAVREHLSGKGESNG